MTRTRARLAAGIGLALAAIIAVVALAGGGTSSPTAASTSASSGPAAPTTEFAYFDGSTGTFADYAGRPLVVNFWASWCPSCVAEMSAAIRPVQEQVGDQVAFVGFNLQDDRDAAVRLIDETGVLFDLAEDPIGDLYTELKGIGMPFTVFISADGEVVHKHNGPVTEQQLLDLIDKHLTGA